MQEIEIISLINKLMLAEGSDNEQEEWINQIREAVPFYEKIINLLFFSNEESSAEAIYQKAKEEHKPIVL